MINDNSISLFGTTDIVISNNVTYNANGTGGTGSTGTTGTASAVFIGFGCTSTTVTGNLIFTATNNGISIFQGNSAVAITDNCIVDKMIDGTKIKDMWGFAVVKEMYNYSKVLKMWEEAKIEKMFDDQLVAYNSMFSGQKPAYSYVQLKADVSVSLAAGDATPPVVTVIAPDGWLKEGQYVVAISATDLESGVKQCEYQVGSCSSGGTSCQNNDVYGLTTWSCSLPIGINATKNSSTWYREGRKVYKICARATNNNNLTSDISNASSCDYLDFDFSPPTTEIK
jgi:hypothetical protein